MISSSTKTSQLRLPSVTVGNFTHVRNRNWFRYLSLRLWFQTQNQRQMQSSWMDYWALVNSQPPRTSKTFDDYANQDILPRVRPYSTKYQRVDIVFDVYKESSLKVEARSKRGKGIRRRVTPTSKTPQNWTSFLRDNNNKTELFHFLADRLSEADMPCLEYVCCNRVIALEDLAPCMHKEADPRIFVHAWDAAMDGSKALIIKANDTDRCGSYCHVCQEILKRACSWKSVDCIWPRRKFPIDSSAWTGKHNRSRESQCERLKTEFPRSQTEAVWCNTTSVCPQATFRACCLPRKNYLGSSHSPSTCHKKSSWLGWSRRGDTWQILWTDIPSVAASCRELTRCGCRKDCCGRCKCLPSGLNCTALCSCLCEK